MLDRQVVDKPADRQMSTDDWLGANMPQVPSHSRLCVLCLFGAVIVLVTSCLNGLLSHNYLPHRDLPPCLLVRTLFLQDLEFEKTCPEGRHCTATAKILSRKCKWPTDESPVLLQGEGSVSISH